MKQIFVHLQKYYIDDLMSEVQEKVDEMNENNCILNCYKFSGLEKNEGLAHAFLLFEKF